MSNFELFLEMVKVRINTSNIAERRQFPKVHEHVAVRFLHFIIVFGGEPTENYELSCTSPASLRVIWMYNLYTEQWKKHTITVENLYPPATVQSCAVTIGEDIYFFGGRIYHEEPATNALWKLTITAKGCIAWSEVKFQDQKKTPSPRCLHSAWEYAGKLWTFGGEGRSPFAYLNEHGNFHGILNFRRIFNSFYNNQLLCYDPSRQVWADIKCSGSIPEPRARHATTITGDQVWLYGGNY